MSKHIITAMRSLAPYMKTDEVVKPSTGLAGRVTSKPAVVDTSDPKQTIANYVKIIRDQRITHGE
jgi:hypothetical protein|tara:strand:+ start:502 stop:696 length:195 start_codon:yes stop_codon:yes gene_type:complete